MSNYHKPEKDPTEGSLRTVAVLFLLLVSLIALTLGVFLGLFLGRPL